MASQLVEPNLNVIGTAGYCLLLQYEVWDTPRPYDYAEQAWNNASFKHANEQPPSDICVPLYWTYYDTADNMEYGHIAAWIPGRGIFSSPFDTETGVEWFANIQAVTDRINRIPQANSRYLGWTEDLATIKLMSGDIMAASEDVVDASVVQLGYNGIMLVANPDPSTWETRIAAGETVGQFLGELINSATHKQVQADAMLGAQARAAGWKPGVLSDVIPPKPLPNMTNNVPSPPPQEAPQSLLQKIWKIIWG